MTELQACELCGESWVLKDLMVCCGCLRVFHNRHYSGRPEPCGVFMGDNYAFCNDCYRLKYNAIDMITLEEKKLAEFKRNVFAQWIARCIKHVPFTGDDAAKLQPIKTSDPRKIKCVYCDYTDYGIDMNRIIDPDDESRLIFVCYDHKQEIEKAAKAVYGAKAVDKFVAWVETLNNDAVNWKVRCNMVAELKRAKRE